VTDPTAAVTTKTRDGTTLAAAMEMAMATAAAAAATEEEEYDGCGITNPRRRLDDVLLHHVDGILLSSIAVTTEDATATAAAGSPATGIDCRSLFIGGGGLGGQRRQQHRDGGQRQRGRGSGGVRARFLGGRAQPTLGGAFREEDDVEDEDEDDGDK
jgi:hypothetical protein